MEKTYAQAISNLLKRGRKLSPFEFITKSIQIDLDHGVITRQEIEDVPDESGFYMDHDIYETGISGCCSAKVYMGGRCKACQEHCDVITE